MVWGTMILSYENATGIPRRRRNPMWLVVANLLMILKMEFKKLKLIEWSCCVMPNYYRRKNGSFCIRVSNGKPNGKQRMVTTTYYPPVGLSYRAAERAAKEYANLFENAVHSGFYIAGQNTKTQHINQQGLTLSEFISEYYYKKIELRLSPNTIRFYQSVIDQFILPSFGEIRICDVSSVHLQSLIDFLSSPGARFQSNNTEPLSGATVKRYSTVFTSVMTEAYKMGFAEKDILHRQYISYPKIYHKPLQAYDDEEAKTFYNRLADECPKVKALLLTSLLLGLRRGEVVGLMWSDFDFKSGCLTVSRSAFKVKGQEQSVKAPKSKSSVRTVYFSEEYADVLKRWSEEQSKEKNLAGSKWEEKGYVFTNKIGDMISLFAPTEICSKFEQKCGLRHLKLHGLRHTCGSLMIKNGVDIETVRSLFGHENIRTTQQYLSAYISAKKTAARLLTDVLMKEGNINEIGNITASHQGISPNRPTDSIE